MILIGIVAMKVQWKILLTSMAMWFLGEIILNLVGLDEVADYGEFLQDKSQLISKVCRSDTFKSKPKISIT